MRVPRRAEVHPGAASPLEDLRYIRQTMESAAAFTAVSGWGMAAVGGVALLAAGVAQTQSDPGRWVTVWVLAAIVAASVSVAANAQKSARSRHAGTKAVMRKFLLAFLPPLFAGAVLTAMLVAAEQWALIVPLWLLMYGTAVLTGGVFSVRLVPAMGACFIAAGLISLALPFTAANATMAAAFGGLHLVFGILIGRRHGG